MLTELKSARAAAAEDRVASEDKMESIIRSHAELTATLSRLESEQAKLKSENTRLERALRLQWETLVAATLKQEKKTLQTQKDNAKR